jgi:ParB family chromosome partitioning protein
MAIPSRPTKSATVSRRNSPLWRWRSSRLLEQHTGPKTTDLLQVAEETYFDDIEQFMALQRAAVEQLAADYAQRAAWVEVTEHRFPEWQYEDAEDGEPSGVVIDLSPTGAVEIAKG